MHRVTLPTTSSTSIATSKGTIGSRYSIPYFVAPDHEAMVACLPSCISTDRPKAYDPVRWCDYGEYMSKHMYKKQDNEEVNEGWVHVGTK